jgi:hypothetical protein
MSKDAYYFPHDANARNDPKLRAMRTVYGAEGLGWFWMLVEILREQENYKLPVNKYTFNALAMELGCQPTQIEKFLKDCAFEFTDPDGPLFYFDEQFLWSKSLLRRMEAIDNKRLQARNAVLSRWNNTRNTPVLLPQYSSNTSKVKERKVKESKVKDNITKQKYGKLQNVFLTLEEYQKLENEFKSSLPDKIENLSLYLASKGDKYKSHYATILSWDRKEKNGGDGNGQQNGQTRVYRGNPSQKPAGAFEGLE